ncbi:MAG TPA: hypothetical protein VJ798_02595 [Rhizomicrobium sp.]|nr:hypothetical protein [Rhizomicrobium sp.]
MSLSPNEAVQTLGEIARTEKRSAEAHCYANASPGFILWGLIWMVGYSGSYLLLKYGLPRGINWLWFSLTAVGVVGSHLIGRYQYRHQNPGQQAEGRLIGFRFGMTFFAMFLFTVAAFTIMRPVSYAATGAFIPLLVSLAYAIFGIWRGLRFLYVGIAVAALTMGGFLYLREFFTLWMAFVGGGSLILVGLWLKKV